MNKILFLIALCISCQAQGQDTLFKIISMKGNVTLDGNSVSCGQTVDSKSQLLIVQGKKSYVSVLTESGFAFQLGKGKHKTKSIAEQEISNLASLNVKKTGAVTYSVPPDIEIVTLGDEYPYLAGDSVTLIWRSLRKVKTDTFKVKVLNIFEEQLMDTTAYSNAVVLPIKRFRNSDLHFLIQISSKKLRPRSALIKSPKRKEKSEFEFDASCISSDDFIQHQLLTASLCEIHNLYYDQIHYLYSLYRYSKKTGIVISHSYYQRLLKEYGFEQFLIIKR